MADGKLPNRIVLSPPVGLTQAAGPSPSEPQPQGGEGVPEVDLPCSVKGLQVLSQCFMGICLYRMQKPCT